MAHVQLSPSIGFHPRSTKDAPGFGFGLTGTSNMSSQSWATSPFQSTQLSALNQLASTSQLSNAAQRPQKRKHEPEETENFRQDEVMDRSPTPERPKRAAPKRIRTVPSTDSVVKDDSAASDSRRATEDKDIDIGVLLATLPSHSLLPILTSLIKSQPSLKSAILPLIPRPTVETATQALAESSKKLREAYPYSNNATFSSTSLGFGFGAGSGGGGMRDSYIQSRLRPHINDFVSTFMSYRPYFSYTPASSQTTFSNQTKPHPTEVFFFLSNLTGHVLSQPQLAQNGIEALLLSKLSEEWSAWVARIDLFVNQEGGMFGSETVHNWIQRLDEFAAKDSQIGHVMRQVRDQWVGRVGWLVGRTNQQRMLS